MRCLTLLAALLVAHAAAGQPPVPDQPARAGVERALPILQRSAASFVEQRTCVSCHHNVLPILTLHMARGRGVSVDAKTLTAIEQRTFDELRRPSALDEAIQGANLSDPTPNDSYLLMAAHAAGLPPTSTTAVYARRIARWQRGDHWATSDFRPPHSSSAFTATATAVRALRLYMPEELAAERDAAIVRARTWLAASTPRSTEDAAFRLFGLIWSGAAAEARDTAVRTLSSRQLPSGGWPQLPGYDGDAYSTGEALVALHDAGVPITDASWQRGIRFLLSTQARDGTWRVRTRMISPATVSPPYFHADFPYGKDEFLSYAGTTWAVMALLSSMPPAAVTVARAGDSAAAPEGPPWIRTALFGRLADLRAQLDAGLDANRATQAGTTILMAAATDAGKVALLLARGARADRRASSGVDAVTVASTYRDSAAVIARLIDAGASSALPPDVRPRHAPLAYAAMAGDTESARLLIARGWGGRSEALSDAITFGNPAIAKALIDAGAEVRIAEASGITLLHWAVITNRAAMIPLLVDAGAPIDAVDRFGFTPLMYAATLDRGETSTLDALLAAGADRRLRSADGRTPLQQAERLGHDDNARALRRAGP